MLRYFLLVLPAFQTWSSPLPSTDSTGTESLSTPYHPSLSSIYSPVHSLLCVLASLRELDLSHNPLDPVFRQALLDARLAQHPSAPITQSASLLYFTSSQPDSSSLHASNAKMETDSQEVDLHALLADLDF